MPERWAFVVRIVSAALASMIVTAGAVLMVGALARDWSDVQHAVRTANWWLLAAALVGAFAGVWLLAVQWRASLKVLGHATPMVPAARWFMTGQLGKYLPGGLWHAVGVGELAARNGVPRRAAYASTGLSTISLVGGASLVVAVGGLAAGDEGVRWWTVALGAVLCGALFVPPLRRVLFKVAGATGPNETPAAVARLVLTAVPVWGTVAVTTWCVAAALGSHVGVATTLVAAVASWLVGILALPAPGGIGVREAVLVLVLRDDMGSGAATAAAVTARLAFIVADVGWVPLSRLLPSRAVASGDDAGDDAASGEPAPAPSSTAAE